jgi:hypothetical protein
MKATALFPDGFRTDHFLSRQIVQSSLQRQSFSKIHLLAFTPGYRMPSPACFCPILVREPSGLGSLFRFQSAGLQEVRPFRLLNPTGVGELQGRGD